MTHSSKLPGPGSGAEQIDLAASLETQFGDQLRRLVAWRLRRYARQPHSFAAEDVVQSLFRRVVTGDCSDPLLEKALEADGDSDGANPEFALALQILSRAAVNLMKDKMKAEKALRRGGPGTRQAATGDAGDGCSPVPAASVQGLRGESAFQAPPGASDSHFGIENAAIASENPELMAHYNDVLNAFLAVLPSERHRIVLQALLDGHKPSEIAVMLGSPRHMVSRMRSQLRQLWTRFSGEAGMGPSTDE